MTGSLALLVGLALLGSLSAAENDDCLVFPFSKQDMTSVIDGLVRERMTEIESRLQQENSDMKAGFKLLEVENRLLKSEVDSIANELEMLKVTSSRTSPVHSNNDTDAEKAFRRGSPYRSSVPQAAFKARLTTKLSDVGSAQVIKYDTVEINIGNDYDPATGIFTCDIPGVYVFHITTMVYENKHLELNFLRNGQGLHNFFVGDTTTLGAGSTMTLAQLGHGDTVLIKSNQYHSPGDLIHPGFSYFSGFLL